MKSILFRCDSSSQLGVGHVTRCLALAQVFYLNNWNVVFSGNFQFPTWHNKMLKDYSNYIFESVEDTNVQKLNYDLVVFDNYSIKSMELANLKKLGNKTLSIVDSYSPNLKTDFYTSTLPIWYLPNFQSIKNGLFGFEYALIRQEIIQAPKFKKGPVSGCETLALFSGGSSNAEFIELILSQVSSIVGKRKIKIFSNDDFLKSKYKGLTNIEITPQKSNFFNDLSDIDLVISPASVSSWEFLYLRFPLALYGIYENQQSTYKYFIDNDLAFGLGVTHDYKKFIINKSEFDNALNFPETKIINSKIDALGANRVYEEIIKSL